MEYKGGEHSYKEAAKERSGSIVLKRKRKFVKHGIFAV
jgi:hypothetical protein